MIGDQVEQRILLPSNERLAVRGRGAGHGRAQHEGERTAFALEHAVDAGHGDDAVGEGRHRSGCCGRHGSKRAVGLKSLARESRCADC